MQIQAKRLTSLLLSPAILLAASTCFGGGPSEDEWRSTLNMPKGVTEMGHTIYDLHMMVLWISVAIGVVVFSIMFASIFVHRKSRGHEPAQFHESTLVEIIWTAVPFVILIAMAYPATITLIEAYDTDDADMDVVVTGYQWKWRYDYVGEDVSFFSNLATPRAEIEGLEPKSENYLLEVDEPLWLPVGKKIRFLVTANDVIHSWWVPDLAVKKDAVPGFMNEISSTPLKTGVYRGQCAELCGKDHGFMPIVVNVVEQAEYDQWLVGKKEEAAKLRELMGQTFTFEEQMARGEKVYQASCAACHGANGEGGVGPAIAGNAVALGPLEEHFDKVINGVPGSAMQAFGGILNDLDSAAVITYQRSGFGNNMGDTIQALDVYKYKSK